MSGRADVLIRDWEARLDANALVSPILSTLNERKSEVQRFACPGMTALSAQLSVHSSALAPANARTRASSAASSCAVPE
jgi:hypothetical protein